MGADKLAAPLGGSTVLGELLARVPPGVPVVVVGPVRDVAQRSPAVLVAREDPPGGGPAAAVAAGLNALATAGALAGPLSWPARLPAAPPAAAGADVLVVLAGDAPWSPLAVPTVVRALRAAPPEAGCAVAVDAEGRLQVLLAAHRLGPLQERLSGGAPAGRSARWLVGAGPVTVVVPEHLLADVDTPDQLAAARARR